MAKTKGYIRVADQEKLRAWVYDHTYDEARTKARRLRCRGMGLPAGSRQRARLLAVSRLLRKEADFLETLNAMDD